MSDETPVAFSADQFLKVIDTIDADIPKLKAFIAAIEANPALTAIAARFVPGLENILPVIKQIGPWLDFLQQLTDAIQAATATT